MAQKVIYTSPEFGTVHTANVLVPGAQYLGSSERKSRLEISSEETGRFEVTLRARTYLKAAGQDVLMRENEHGLRAPRSQGSFATEAQARQFVADFINDYNRTASEEHAHASRWQQHQEYKSVYGSAKSSTDDALRSIRTNSNGRGR